MQLELPLSPYRHHPGDCGQLTVRAAEVSDGTRDRVTLGTRDGEMEIETETEIAGTDNRVTMKKNTEADRDKES